MYSTQILNVKTFEIPYFDEHSKNSHLWGPRAVDQGPGPQWIPQLGEVQALILRFWSGERGPGTAGAPPTEAWGRGSRPAWASGGACLLSASPAPPAWTLRLNLDYGVPGQRLALGVAFSCRGSQHGWELSLYPFPALHPNFWEQGSSPLLAPSKEKGVG